MKFLIVDDDPVSRQLLINILSEYAECEPAVNGMEALAAYKKAWEDWAPFDLLTLDISMPEMDGKKVLQAIRAMENEKKVPKDKRVKILMSSSQIDKETILACVQMGCDDYISKPFDREIILKKMFKLGIPVSVPKITAEESVQKSSEVEAASAVREESKRMLKEGIQRIVHRFKQGNIELPVLPQVVNDVRKVMTNPNATVDDLSRAIEKDSVISIRIIAGANSPFYRGTEKITTLDKAIMRLGFRETGSIVNAITNKNLYDTKDATLQSFMENQWMHSLASAYGAKSISQRLDMNMEDYLFLLGLTHDIGMVLLLRHLDSSLFKNIGTSGMTELYPVVRKVHAEFGAAIVKRWGFSDDFIRIILLHDSQDYNENTPKEALVVNLAMNMAYRLGYGIFKIDLDLAQLDSARLLGIDPGSFDEILDETKGNLTGAFDIL